MNSWELNEGAPLVGEDWERGRPNAATVNSDVSRLAYEIHARSAERIERIERSREAELAEIGETLRAVVLAVCHDRLCRTRERRAEDDPMLTFGDYSHHCQLESFNARRERRPLRSTCSVACQ